MPSSEAFSITSTTTAEPKVTGVSRAASSARSVAPSIGVVARGEDTATRMRRGVLRVCSRSCTAVSVQRTRGVRGSRATKVSVCGSRSSSQGSTSAPPSKRSMIRRPEPTAPRPQHARPEADEDGVDQRAVKRTSPRAGRPAGRQEPVRVARRGSRGQPAARGGRPLRPPQRGDPGPGGPHRRRLSGGRAQHAHRDLVAVPRHGNVEVEIALWSHAAPRLADSLQTGTDVALSPVNRALGGSGSAAAPRRQPIVTRSDTRPRSARSRSRVTVRSCTAHGSMVLT